MSADMWEETHYRLQVWEGNPVFWPTGQIKGRLRPSAGDRMFCWYAKTHSTSPGLCGWGVVLSYDSNGAQIVWRPVFPSDFMKMHPLYDVTIAAKIDAIRGRVAQGTLWRIERSDADWLAERVQLFAK